MRIQLLGKGLSSVNTGFNPVTSQIRQNMYLEILPDGDKYNVVALSMPGYKHYYSIPGIDGSLYFLVYDQSNTSANNLVYLTAHKTGDPSGTFRIYKYGIDSGINETELGVICTNVLNTDFFSFGYCASTNEIVTCPVDNDAVATNNVYSTINFTGPPVATGPAGVISTYATFGAGRFIVDDRANAGRFYWSDLLDGRTWPALNFTTDEDVGKIRALKFVNNTLVVMGSRAIAFYAVTADPNLPYQKMQGVNIWRGLSRRSAFFVREINGDIYLITTSRASAQPLELSVIRGYAIESLYVFDSEYQEFAAKASFDFTYRGHIFYGIWQGTNDSILFDTTAQAALGYDGQVLSSMSMQKNVPLGGLPNRQMMFVTVGTSVCWVDPTAEVGYFEKTSGVQTSITRRLVLPHIADKDGIKRVVMQRFRLDANGKEIPTLAISRDGGITYGSALTGVRLGNGFEWRRLGQSRNFTLKIESTGVAGAYTAWQSAFADLEVGAS